MLSLAGEASAILLHVKTQFLPKLSFSEPNRQCFPCKAPFFPKIRSLLQLLYAFSLPPHHLFLSLIYSSLLMSTEAKGPIWLTASHFTGYRSDTSTPLYPHSHTSSSLAGQISHCFSTATRDPELPAGREENHKPPWKNAWRYSLLSSSLVSTVMRGKSSSKSFSLF